MLKSVELYILLFFTYSFAGWLMESIGGIFIVKKFVNRGFLIGPYCPVYGVGVVIVTLLLKNYINDVLALFVFATLICGMLEYFTSYIMEKLFNARWWDYHNKKFNINGRICLETLIPFGIAATVILSYINPFLFKIYGNLSDLILNIIVGVLSCIFIVDLIISFIIISSFKNQIYANKDNTEEIVNLVKDKTEDVLMQAESDIKLFSRKLKIKKIKFQRKVRYTRKKLSGAVYVSSKALADNLNNKRMEFINKIEHGKERIDNQIKIKRAEFEMKQKEKKEIISTAYEKRKNQIQNFQKESKEKINSKILDLDEFNKKIIDEFRKKSYLAKRLMNAFPSLKINKNKKE